MKYRDGCNREDLLRLSRWRSTYGSGGYRSLIGKWYAEETGIVGRSRLEVYHKNRDRIWERLFPEERVARS